LWRVAYIAPLLQSIQVNIIIIIKATAISIKKKSKNVVYKIGEILRRNGYAKIEVVAHARIALVKFRDPSQSIDIDLTLNGKLALHNSDLIKAYLTADSSGMVLDMCYYGSINIYVFIHTYVYVYIHINL
jgi:DNA polymerase sigma